LLLVEVVVGISMVVEVVAVDFYQVLFQFLLTPLIRLQSELVGAVLLQLVVPMLQKDQVVATLLLALL
jgi:hypothetical protein